MDREEGGQGGGRWALYNQSSDNDNQRPEDKLERAESGTTKARDVDIASSIHQEMIRTASFDEYLETVHDRLPTDKLASPSKSGFCWILIPQVGN